MPSQMSASLDPAPEVWAVRDAIASFLGDTKPRTLRQAIIGDNLYDIGHSSNYVTP